MAYKKSKGIARKAKGRSKTKGKQPTKREQAQMLALSEIGHGPYEIGEIMGRAPNTVRKYCQSPIFTDPKFAAMVEEYKTKEVLDLTVMNISARARIHDLIPTMTPIEAIATMDKSFQQRRLVEGKSTENIFSLRKIISDAHSEMRIHESDYRNVSPKEVSPDTGTEIRQIESDSGGGEGQEERSDPSAV